MNQRSRRLLRVFGIVVAVILLGLAFYPGTLAAPDTAPEFSYSVTVESTDEFDRVSGVIESQHGSDPDVYQYEELSPLVQDLFDQTRQTESGESYTTPVCFDYMIFCHGHSRNALLDEEFEEFSLAEDVQTRDAFVFVDDGTDQYLLVMTQPSGHTEAQYHFRVLLVGLAMLPAAVFVATVSIKSRSERVLAGTACGAALVAGLGLFASSVHSTGIVSADTLLLLVLIGVWLPIIGSAGYCLFHWSSRTKEQHSADSE